MNLTFYEGKHALLCVEEVQAVEGCLMFCFPSVSSVSWPCSGQASNAVMVMEVFVPSGLGSGMDNSDFWLLEIKIPVSVGPVNISACSVPAWQGALVPGAAVKFILSMSTDSSAWTTPLPLLSQCLSQRTGEQGTADSPASSSRSCRTAQPARNVQL